MQIVYTVVEAVNLDTRVEAQLDRARNQTSWSCPSDSLHPMANKGKQASTTQQNGKFSEFGGSSDSSKYTNMSRKDVSQDIYAKPRGDKCYRCGQTGHFSNQCPKRRLVNFAEAEDEDEEYLNDLEDPTFTYKEDEVIRED